MPVTIQRLNPNIRLVQIREYNLGPIQTLYISWTELNSNLNRPKWTKVLRVDSDFELNSERSVSETAYKKNIFIIYALIRFLKSSASES